jgi:hypothetical protein
MSEHIKNLISLRDSEAYSGNGILKNIDGSGGVDSQGIILDGEKLP